MPAAQERVELISRVRRGACDANEGLLHRYRVVACGRPAVDGQGLCGVVRCPSRLFLEGQSYYAAAR